MRIVDPAHAKSGFHSRFPKRITRTIARNLDNTRTATSPTITMSFCHSFCLVGILLSTQFGYCENARRPQNKHGIDASQRSLVTFLQSSNIALTCPWILMSTSLIFSIKNGGSNILIHIQVLTRASSSNFGSRYSGLNFAPVFPLAQFFLFTANTRWIDKIHAVLDSWQEAWMLRSPYSLWGLAVVPPMPSP